MQVRHPLVNKVSFTGSVKTGMDVMHGAAESVKGVTLELGGKSPAIVFEDADMATTVEWVMFGCFWTNGQICSATSRLLVHENIADKFVAALVAHAANIKMGDPMDPDCRLGPLVSSAQQQKVLGMIDEARKQGAEVVCGGAAQDKDVLPTGYFVQPTVLRVTQEMDIWNEGKGYVNLCWCLFIYSPTSRTRARVATQHIRKTRCS
jgi:betaine-aldehyde dehydrogenase